MDSIKKPLLEAICSKANCGYLSDLTQKINRAHISCAVTELNLTDYDEAEWITAAGYISVNKQSFKTADQARKYLMGLK